MTTPLDQSTILRPSLVPVFLSADNIRTTRILNEKHPSGAIIHTPEYTVVRDQLVRVEVQMLSVNLDFRSRAENYEPQLYMRGRIVSIINDDTRPLPYSINRMSLAGREIEFSRIYRFDSEDLGILASSKGLYDGRFGIPARLTSKDTLWRLPMTLDGVFYPPSTPDDPPLVYIDITDLHEMEMDKETSGYNLIEHLPNVDPTVNPQNQLVNQGLDVPVVNITNELEFESLHEPTSRDYESRISHAAEQAAIDRDKVMDELGINPESVNRYELALRQLKASQRTLERDVAVDSDLTEEQRQQYKEKMLSIIEDFECSMPVTASQRELLEKARERAERDGAIVNAVTDKPKHGAEESIMATASPAADIDIDRIDVDTEAILEASADQAELHPEAHGHRPVTNSVIPGADMVNNPQPDVFDGEVPSLDDDEPSAELPAAAEPEPVTVTNSQEFEDTSYTTDDERDDDFDTEPEPVTVVEISPSTTAETSGTHSDTHGSGSAAQTDTGETDHQTQTHAAPSITSFGGMSDLSASRDADNAATPPVLELDDSEALRFDEADSEIEKQRRLAEQRREELARREVERLQAEALNNSDDDIDYTVGSQPVIEPYKPERDDNSFDGPGV